MLFMTFADMVFIADIDKIVFDNNLITLFL